MITRISRLAGIALLVLASAAVVRADVPTVLSQVPDNSIAVLVVNNVDALKIQIANYAKQMDVPLPADPLSVPLQSLGITGGFDAAGSFAVVQVPVPQESTAPGDPQTPFIMLLPTTDAKLLMAGMTPGDAADNITPVTFSNNATGYAATIGKYVAIGRNRAMMAEFLTHKGRMDKPAPEFLKAINENNIAIWIDVPEESKVVGPMWKMYSQAMRMMVARADPAAAQGQKMGLDMMDAIGDALSSDVQNALITLKISEDGISLDTTGIAMSDTTLAKFVTVQAALAPASMTGIPSADYMMAFAAKWDPDQAAQAVGKVMDWSLSVNPIVQANPDMAPKMKEIVEQLIPLETGMRGYANMTPGGKTGMSGVYIIDTKDPQKVLNLTIKNASIMVSKTGDMHTDAQVQPDALNVGGVSFTQIITKFTLRDETPDNPIPANVKRQFEAMQRIMPPGGMVNNVGVIGNQVVAVMTGDPKDQKLVGDAVASLQAGKNNFADIQDTAPVKRLTLPNATALVYVRIDKYIDFVMAAIGRPAETQEAAQLPLIWSLNTGNQSVTSRLALPKKTLINLVEKYHGANGAAQSP